MRFAFNILFSCFSFLCLAFSASVLLAQEQNVVGKWTAALKTPGGPLRFGLEIEQTKTSMQGWLINNPERIKIPKIDKVDDGYKIDIDHYDSTIVFQRNGENLVGTWTKRRGKQETAEIPFSATKDLGERSTDDPKPVLGTWKVQFEGDQDIAVAIIRRMGNSNQISGTFLTTTGDYRYLAGQLNGRLLTLSCFDGAHAFLFTAELTDEGQMNGQFYSGNWWKTTWVATKDEKAALPDAFKQTRLNENADLGSIRFPDVDGHQRSLMDEEYAGKARIIYVFGSWCPNCHDAAEFLVELDNQYRDKGLSILGLAFELTGDFQRDSEQIKKYKKRHNATYPVLIAGLSDKKLASQALPFLDKVRSYPTTIFLDRNGKVSAIHTGFSGPATGEAHHKLKKQFKEKIEELLR